MNRTTKGTKDTESKKKKRTTTDYTDFRITQMNENSRVQMRRTGGNAPPFV